MNKQTAIQILVESMTTSDVSFYSKEIAIALQLERSQIYHAWNDGCSEGIEGGQSTNCEEFYNNTYGSKYE